MICWRCSGPLNISCRRRNTVNIHVRSYKEKGTTTTPFDTVVLIQPDRCQPALDAMRRISPRLPDQAEAATACLAGSPCRACAIAQTTTRRSRYKARHDTFAAHR